MNRYDGPGPEDGEDSIDIELDWSDVRTSEPSPETKSTSGDRITVPPPVPTDQYAAELMATAEGSWDDLPPSPEYDAALPTQLAPPPLESRPPAYGGEIPPGLRHSEATAPKLPAVSVPPALDGSALHEVRGRFALGDYSGALVIAESILDSNPSNEEAKRYAAQCRDALADLYLSRLGGLTRVPQLAVPPDQLHWLSLDHRAGFLLSLIDGMSTVEDVLDMSGMSSLEVLRTIFELVQQDVVHLA